MTGKKERIGRLDENLIFESVTLKRNGRLSVDGKFGVEPDREDRLFAARDLLLAHVGNEFEPVVPWVSNKHARWSGYHILDDASIDMGAGSLDGLVNYPISLELSPVTSKQRPIIESILWGGPRQGREDHDGSWWAIPKTAIGLHATPADIAVLSTQFTGPGGTVRVFYNDADNEVDDTFYDARTSYVLQPQFWYDMACTLRVGGQIVVGRQTLDAPDDWAIDNGLIRVESGDGDSLLRVTLPAGWDASTWGASYDIHVGYDNGPGYTSIADAVAVYPVRVRNEEVSIAIRCEFFPAGDTEMPEVMTVYVSMRRGATHLTVTTATASTTRRPAIWLDGTPSSTAIGSGADERGFYRLADDGLYLTFGQSEAGGNVDTDQANSRILTTDGQPILEAGIGYAKDPSSIYLPDQPVHVVAMWCAAQSETAFVRRGG